MKKQLWMRRIASFLIIWCIVCAVISAVWKVRAEGCDTPEVNVTEEETKITGWQEINGKIYYFDENGIMQKNKMISKK